MRLDDDLKELAASQHSVIAGWQASELGASRTEWARMRRSKLWTPITDRVLQIAGVPTSPAVRASAAVLDAGPGAVLSHSSAAAWWRLPGFSLRHLHVSQPRPSATRDVAIATLHDLRALPEQWLTCLDGIAIVCPELLVYQLCGMLHPGRAERALDAAWSRGLLSGDSTRHCLEELRRSGRNGTTLLETLLTARGLGYIPPASGLESRVKTLGEEAGLRLRRQVDSGGHRWTGRVDFRDEELPLVVEAQSELYHAALSDKTADAARFAALQEAGFVVLEVWDTAVFERPREVVDGLHSARRAARHVLPGQRTHFCVR